MIAWSNYAARGTVGTWGDSMPKPAQTACLILAVMLVTAACEEDTSSDCNKGVFTGHVTIADDSEPASYEGYTQITGNLTISCPNCETLEALSCLASVGGDLAVSTNGSLEALDVGRLVHVGGSLYAQQNPSLADLDLRSLRVVGSWLTIRDNAALSAIHSGALNTIGGDVAISDNGALTTVELGSLWKVPGSLAVTGNGALADLDGLAGLLFLEGGLTVSSNGALPFCETCELLDQLQGFAGEVSCSSNLVDECWSGTALDCPPPAGDGAILDPEG